MRDTYNNVTNLGGHVSSSSQSPKTWKVATLNVQAGLSTHKYRDYITQSWHHISPTSAHKHKNLMDICGAVQHLDVFGVQEIDPGSWRSGFKNQAMFLAEHGRFNHWSYQANRNTGLSTTANGIFSKNPLKMIEHWTLPSRKSSVAPRGAMRADVEDDNGHTWCCAVAHFSLNAQDRLAQASFLAERLTEEKNILLLGDFNDVPSSPSLKPLDKIFDQHTDLLTYPRWSPRKAIDLAWWRGLDVSASAVQCWGGTDHCGVELTFQIPRKSSSRKNKE